LVSEIPRNAKTLNALNSDPGSFGSVKTIEHFTGARRGDRARIQQPAIGHHLGAAGGVVGGDDLDLGQGAQKALALRQPLRVRVDAAQAVQGRAREREQMVDDRELDLTDDRQRALEQQVVVAMDAAADRVLDWQDAVRRPACLNGVEHLVEAAAGRQRRVGIDSPGGRLAEGARLALIGNCHRRRRLHTAPA
jgi:hypothetical protein